MEFLCLKGYLEHLLSAGDGHGARNHQETGVWDARALSSATRSGERFWLWSSEGQFEIEQRHTFFILSLFRQIILQIIFWEYAAQLIHYQFHSSTGRRNSNSGWKGWIANKMNSVCCCLWVFFLNKGTLISSFRILAKVIYIVSYWTVLEPIHLLRIFAKQAIDYFCLPRVQCCLQPNHCILCLSTKNICPWVRSVEALWLFVFDCFGLFGFVFNWL